MNFPKDAVLVNLYDAAHENFCKHLQMKAMMQSQDLGEGKGTDYVFVEHECYHRGGLYCDRDGKEFPDNLFRYALLTVAAMEAPLILSLRGSTFGQDVLFVANDWQTGLLPVYHLYKYRRNRTYLNSRCIFVIHNIGYQAPETGSVRQRKIQSEQGPTNPRP